MVRCINIDWLELYCLEPIDSMPLDAQYYRDNGYSVDEREYGTRVYEQMFTILDERGYPFIEVRRKPMSNESKDGGLFPVNACHIRLSNYYCYNADPIGVLREHLVKHRYEVVRIFRIDICMDFEHFDRGDEPARFMKRYMDGRYSKVYQSNISAHGVDTWERRIWNSVSWGNRKSMIGTKFYCKSLELKQVHDKPYIRYTWYRAGLIGNPITGLKKGSDGKEYEPTIWRLEFSIHSSAKKWFIIEDTTTRKKRDLYMEHTLSMYDNPRRLATVFASLCSHYFRFKVYEDGVRKDRCKDKVLFDWSYLDEFLTPDRAVAPRPASGLLDRLRYLINTYKAKKMNPEIHRTCNELLSYIDEDALKTFVGGRLTASDIIILQRMIAERVGSLNASERETRVSEIKQNVSQYADTIF